MFKHHQMLKTFQAFYVLLKYSASCGCSSSSRSRSSSSSGGGGGGGSGGSGHPGFSARSLRLRPSVELPPPLP